MNMTRTKAEIRKDIRKRTCNYRECTRPRYARHTMCAGHSSAGMCIAQLRQLLKIAPT